MLRKMASAISWLLRPLTISASISASRGVSPASRPGQSPAPTAWSSTSGLGTGSPQWIASKASTSSTADNPFDRYPATPSAALGPARGDDVHVAAHSSPVRLLDNDHPIPVVRQHPCDPRHHDLVVVDDRQA